MKTIALIKIYWQGKNLQKVGETPRSMSQCKKLLLSRKGLRNIGTCVIHGSSLLTDTTRYRTKLCCVLFLIILYVASFSYHSLLCGIFFSMPTNSQLLTLGSIVKKCTYVLSKKNIQIYAVFCI